MLSRKLPTSEGKCVKFDERVRKVVGEEVAYVCGLKFDRHSRRDDFRMAGS